MAGTWAVIPTPVPRMKKIEKLHKFAVLPNFPRNETLDHMLFPLFAVLLVTADNGVLARKAGDDGRKPIMLDSSGGFEIGGRILVNPKNPNETLSCDHGYVEYFIPWTPRKSSLVMWHSSSTQVFQNRWDGGPGYKDLFLSRDYPTYLWDGPRVGRANWACVPITYTPGYRDQSNFAGWNFGPSYMNWWPDVQFPINDTYAWQQATSARYDEFDTDENVLLHADAMAAAADSGKLGEEVIYLTNSAGGLRAQMATTRANGTNIAAIVTYESIGYVFPDNINITANTIPGFGPFVVPVEQFKKLANLTAVQFVWGDHRAEYNEFVKQSRWAAKLINEYGGNAEVLMLGEKGLKGSTHIAFADMDNEKVAGLLEEFLQKNELDGYVDEDERQR
ncbi:uncharacterized protein PAC_14291 [Phialocephala subalpina]|uniref:Fusarubin cluster-esterase n=1 Tax=Phialocephala subalpina TaxID=576137 RepID=A0A1L7XH67_9HELO|nr:uncharacterized protein PAC_14291 [Phialocephala subalpina]